MSKTDWVPCTDHLPPQNVTVETMISDSGGIRNHVRLKFYKGHWFFEDMSMYIYYNPTHWRPVVEK